MPPIVIFFMEKIDTKHIHETPEGIDLEVCLAGPVIRARAWSFDFLLRLLIYVMLYWIVIFTHNSIGMAIGLISFFCIEWFYPVIFEVYRGATIGKKRMGLTVVNDNGVPVSWSSSLTRNLLLVIDLYGIGLLSMLFSRHFKRLGDHAAGTLVIYKKSPVHRQIRRNIQPKKPPSNLTLDERVTLLTYIERADQLSMQRRIELTDLLQHLTHKTGIEGEQEIRAYAIWLMGER